MREDSISFVCTGCSATLKVKSSSAGRQLKCPKCKAKVQVPVPGQEWLRKKCCECGTEHDLKHADICETCHAPESEQSKWCTVHRNLISSGVCADCLIQYHELTFPPNKKSPDPSKTSAFPPTMHRDRTTPPPVTPPTTTLPPIITTTTETAPKPVNPIEDSRWPLRCGIVALGFLFCCPCVASILGLIAIGMAADSQSKIAKADQVGMVQFKIIAGYVCGGGVVLLDGLRILIFAVQYLVS